MWEQAARSKCPISRAEADIVAQRQLRIGIIAAHQPVDHAAECRSLQTQFLREGLELPESAGSAIEQVSGVIVIIAGILGLILAIGRDAGQLRGAKIVIDLPRQAPVLQLAYIFPARRDAEAAVIGIIRENRALKAQYVNNSIGRIDAEATACRRTPPPGSNGK